MVSTRVLVLILMVMEKHKDIAILTAMGASRGGIATECEGLGAILDHFEIVLPGNYWTSTPAGADRNRLFVANTWNGILRALEQSNYYYIWPVRTAREL